MNKTNTKKPVSRKIRKAESPFNRSGITLHTA